MAWTEEKVKKLKELWGKGNTASQIAEIIGGISRNAVIGKAHRLNLSAKIMKWLKFLNKFLMDQNTGCLHSLHLVPEIPTLSQVPLEPLDTF